MNLGKKPERKNLHAYVTALAAARIINGIAVSCGRREIEQSSEQFIYY